MGNILALFKKKKEFKLIMQGLDAAGKTTILYKLKLGEVVTTIPTIGFNVESLEYENVSLTVWDVGTRSKMRPLYRHYYPNCQAVIYVIDSNDTDRLDEAKYELKTTLEEDDLRNVVVLILANKQDLPKATSAAYLTEALELHKVRQTCNIFPISATTGEGLPEAMEWLSQTMYEEKTPYKSSHTSGYLQKSWEAMKKIFVG